MIILFKFFHCACLFPDSGIRVPYFLQFFFTGDGCPNRRKEQIYSCYNGREFYIWISQCSQEIPPFALHILVVHQRKHTIKAILFIGRPTILEGFLDGGLQLQTIEVECPGQIINVEKSFMRPVNSNRCRMASNFSAMVLSSE